MKFIGLLLLFASSCTSQVSTNDSLKKISSFLPSVIQFDEDANLLHKRVPTPKGFERVELDSSSFGFYLRTLPLKPHLSQVTFFNGKKKLKNNVYCAVIDQDIDPVDLQQCADAVMRLKGEYLFSQKRFADIHFNFLSDGKPRYFIEYSNGDFSYRKFRSYMKYIFSYANTGSLKNELHVIEKIDEMSPGDVFIQSGSPYGHAVIIVDVAQNAEGKKIFLLAQSYMPAQETQLLINPSDSNLSPWYSFENDPIETPEWTFYEKDLRRFKD